MEPIKEDLRSLFIAGVVAVDPQVLVKKNLSQISDSILVVGDRAYMLKHNLYVVGFGKAVLNMAVALDLIVQEHIVKGIISVPEGIQEEFLDTYGELPLKNPRIEVHEGARNNFPDDKAAFAAKRIEELVASLGEADILFVLISGGGSALLPSPKDPITYKEKASLIQTLAKRGANIFELNCVRKRLSMLKGGGLAKAAYPAQVIGLVISDVLGDSLEIIASGPTCANKDKLCETVDVLKKYSMFDSLPESVRTVLTNEEEAQDRATFDHVFNLLIGTNKIALEAIRIEAGQKGFHPMIMRPHLEGEARIVGAKLAESIIAFLVETYGTAVELNECLKGFTFLEGHLTWRLHATSHLPDKDALKPILLIFGGETTVVVHGKGKGGRNQELALSFAIHLEEVMSYCKTKTGVISKFDICLLSAGTDGIDGPTDAAGAFGYAGQVEIAAKQSLEPIAHLLRNDSYGFYQKLNNGKDLLITGHTGTNVMDILMVIIKPSTAVLEDCFSKMSI